MLALADVDIQRFSFHWANNPAHKYVYIKHEIVCTIYAEKCTVKIKEAKKHTQSQRNAKKILQNEQEWERRRGSEWVRQLEKEK